MKQFGTFVIVVLLFARLGAATAEESRQFKTRALWLGSESFATAEAADNIIARCTQAKINTILPNVMSHGRITFKSPHFHGRVMVNERFDPLAYLLSKAHAAGIRVQAWCCVYYEGARKPSKPEWLTLSLDGRPFEQNFLSPANPEVNPYLLSVMADLLAYDIDGIHLDYIRYPGTAFDYSEAARKAFKTSSGYDPQNFLDHPERIVPAEQERFPVRVLHPKAHADKVWELTAIERTLDQAGIGFAFISESPANIAALRVPSLLIISSYYEVSPSMARALADYVARGGNTLWTDVPAPSLPSSPVLQKLTGLAASRWIGERRIALQVASDHPLAQAMSVKPFRTESFYGVTLQGAQIIAKLDTGEPAVMLNVTGKGRVVVLGFHLMKSTSPVVASLAKGLVDWFRTDAGVIGPDPLAPKRAEWVTWRGERVTQLVRDTSLAAKQKNPGTVISSSGGPSPWEFYACYRDARRWLAEGMNDQVFPMNYTPDPAVLSDMLDLQTASAPAGKFNCVFPGLQIYASRVVNGKNVVEPIDAAIVEKELRVVQQHGYEGFCLFSDVYLNDEIVNTVSKFNDQTR